MKKLTELRPATLRSYQNKAKEKTPIHKKIAKDYASRTDPDKKAWTDKMAKVHARKAKGHEKGVARAQKRLNQHYNEVEGVEEGTVVVRGKDLKDMASRLAKSHIEKSATDKIVSLLNFIGKKVSHKKDIGSKLGRFAIEKTLDKDMKEGMETGMSAAAFDQLKKGDKITITFAPIF